MRSPLTLTICTVSFHSEHWLSRNVELTRRLAPEARVSWVIADNAHGPRTALPSGPDVRVIPGAAFVERPYAASGYHHGSGMNETLRHVRTRFALFLDPDFFVVRPGWVGTLLEHAERSRLAVIGVPWHPRWPYKYRYFPCVHCMLVDGEQVPFETLDFRSDYDAVPGHARTKQNSGTPKGPWSRLLPVLDPLRLRKRRFIGTSRDVGWRIFENLHGRVRSECMVPVFAPPRKFSTLAERLLPDGYRLVPGRPASFSERGFAAAGLPDITAFGWEEFLWRGQPFGFHVRAQPKLKEHGTLAQEEDRIDAVLAAVCSAAQGAAAEPPDRPRAARAPITD